MEGRVAFVGGGGCALLASKRECDWRWDIEDLVIGQASGKQLMVIMVDGDGRHEA